MRNEPKIRFEEFKDEWIQIQLGQVCNKPQYGMNSAATKFDGIHKYIRITDINENNNLFLPKPLVSPSGTLDDSFIVKENDILFTRTGASVGKSYIYNHEDGLLYYAGFLIRFNVRNYPSKFVFYQTQTHKYKNWVRVTSIRSGQPGINANEYSKFQFFMPKNQEESNKTSSFLSVIDSKINLLEEKLENLKLFKRGLTDRIFHELEKNHPKKKLCDISERMFSGGTPRSTEKSYYGGDIKFLTISDITKSSKHLINVSKYITQLGLDNSSSKIVLPGTLIFTMYATIAIPIIAKTTVAIPQSVMAIELYENMDVDFIYYQLFSMTNLVRSKYTETGTQGNINSSIVKNLKLIIPDIATQITVSRKLNQMEKKIEMIENKLQSLKKFKRGLLQQVFI